VGEKLPNVFGLHDMHGNVWEWCEDCWHDSYADKPESLKQTGEVWTTGGGFGRVLRGGSWSGLRQDLRAAGRFSYRYLTVARDGGAGFRVARTLFTS
jgi:formylglycine-generating enzyme required for sulfatase activity